MTPLQALEVCARAAAEAADECSRISRQAAHAAATQAAAAKTPRAVEDPAAQDGSKIEAAHWVRRMLARQVISQSELTSLAGCQLLEHQLKTCVRSLPSYWLNRLHSACVELSDEQVVK